VPQRALLAEFGQRPLQYHWWRGALTFWNDAVRNKNSPLLKWVVASDVQLALNGCKTNWTAEVRSALHSIAYQGLGPSPSLDPMPVDGIMDLWMLHYNSYWAAFQEDTGSYRDPTARNRLACLLEIQSLTSLHGQGRWTERLHGCEIEASSLDQQEMSWVS